MSESGKATLRHFPPPEDDWWICEQGQKTCKKCGEDRLTHTVTDFRGQQVFCSVCSHSWWACGRQKNWRD